MQNKKIKVTALLIAISLLTACGKKTTDSEEFTKKVESKKEYYLSHPDDMKSSMKWCSKNIIKVQNKEVSEEELINCRAASAAFSSEKHGF